jgi:hypothetical protein
MESATLAGFATPFVFKVHFLGQSTIPDHLHSFSRCRQSERKQVVSYRQTLEEEQSNRKLLASHLQQADANIQRLKQMRQEEAKNLQGKKLHVLCFHI